MYVVLHLGLKVATSPTKELPDKAPVPSGLLAGRYQVLSVLGRGAMGDVYLARHVHAGRVVALKVVSSHFASDERICERVRAEAQACSAARHPNIVEVFDAGELEDGRPYVAMEYLEGRRLLDLFEADGPLPIARACRILADVARAIGAAHKVGIIHRDLKAENVMIVVRDGVELVKVLDFGIAAAVYREGGRATMPGIGIGTPEYMAPEQVYGADPTPRFDIYALGVLMFEALTGKLPFSDDQPSVILQRKATTPAPLISEHRPELPVPLAKLVNECLALEPEHRPSSVDEIVRVLESYLSEAPAIIDPPTSRPRARTPVMVMTGAAITTLVVGAIALWPRDQAASVAVAEPAGMPVETKTEPAPQPDIVVAPPPSPTAPEVVTVPVPVPMGAPPPAEPKRGSPPVADPPVAAPSVVEVPTKAAPDPAKKPRKDPEPSADEWNTPECERTRQEATDARDAHDWGALLKATQKSSCWEAPILRKRMRVKAFLESHRFAECLEAAGSSEDSEIRRDARICEKRNTG